MILKCTGFMDVNMNRMFSVSSNVSLDPGLVCDENFKNHGYLEGRDTFPVPQTICGHVGEWIWHPSFHVVSVTLES